jgi:seryl-tRNA synthetase
MLDIKFIRDNTETVKKALNDRGAKIALEVLLSLDEQKRALLGKVEALKSQRNKVSDEIGGLKRQKKDSAGLITKMQGVSEEIKTIDEEIKKCGEEIQKMILDIPNIPDATVPAGKSSEDNKTVRTWGQKREFNFKALPHWDIGEKLDVLDFKRAVKIAGARFPLYKGLGARLEMAIINFMLSVARENGYVEIVPPLMVNTQSMTATGQLPKFEIELYKTRDDDYYFIPTAEVPLTNIHREEILQEKELPLKYTAYTPCFRRESGSYGKDTRGLIRNHQFDKIELVKFVLPEESMNELETLLGNAEKILQLLDLPYRVIILCTGDLGFSATKTYDLEVWMPGEGRFVEISSCGNFGDFQARRAEIKYRTCDNKVKFLHTLNGSALAVGRTFAAILENYQNEDGSVDIPEVLRPYMGGIEKIVK